MCWSWTCLSFGSKLQLSSFQLSNISFKWKLHISKDLFPIAETQTEGNTKNKMKGELPAFCGHWEWNQGVQAGWGPALWSHTHCCSEGAVPWSTGNPLSGIAPQKDLTQKLSEEWARGPRSHPHPSVPLSQGTASPSLGAEGREHSHLCISSFPRREVGLVQLETYLSGFWATLWSKTFPETRVITSLVLREGEQSRQQTFPRTLIWQGGCRIGTIPEPRGHFWQQSCFWVKAEIVQRWFRQDLPGFHVSSFIDCVPPQGPLALAELHSLPFSQTVKS